MNVLAVIITDDRDSPLGILSQQRSGAAIPFAGKYRIIDFALSNCSNSGILDIGILTQYQPHSLNNHIRTGRPWDLDRRLSGGVTLLPPYQRNGCFLDWYRGTADAVYQNLDFVLSRKADTILVLSGDRVYKMDYEPLIHYHHQRRADVTVCAIDVPLGKSPPFNTLVTDDQGRVTEFPEKPFLAPNTLACMNVYVFKTDVMRQRLIQDARQFDSTHDLDRDVLPRMLALGDRIYAYRFEGYSMNVGTVQTYWGGNMDLLLPDPPLNILDPDWSIHTRNECRPPVSVYPDATVSNSLISDGCVIKGRVKNSVLSPGVRVWAGAVVRDSVVFGDCEIKSGATVDRAILDKNVVIGQDVRVGVNLNGTSYLNYPNNLHSGITLIGKNTRLPNGLRVGRDCVICSDLTADDFVTNFVINNQRVGLPSVGATVEPELVAPERRNDLPVASIPKNTGRRNG
jgi:glucose-1-phosphate adenylyltransferase